MNDSFLWLIRREIWETRAIWMAPAICAAILVFSALAGGLQVGELQFRSLGDPGAMAKLAQLGPGGIGRIAGVLLVLIAVPFYVAALFVQFFYALDALSSDRRDRSVLFWKSLPVSDAATVLSKVAVATVVIPAAAWAGALAGQLAVHAVVAIKLAGSGLPYAEVLWSPGTWLPALATTLYGAVAVMIWSLPAAGWLLFVSALAPRSPFLWATLPPLAMGLVEQATFGSTHLLRLVGDRTWGVFRAAFRSLDTDGIVTRLGGGDTMLAAGVASLMQPLAFLANPAVWGGVLVGAVFVAGAIWARRYRDETA